MHKQEEMCPLKFSGFFIFWSHVQSCDFFISRIKKGKRKNATDADKES